MMEQPHHGPWHRAAMERPYPGGAGAGWRRLTDPHLQVALGLLAPKLLGQDIDKALEHFEFAAKALQDDGAPPCSRRWRTSCSRSASRRSPGSKAASAPEQRLRARGARALQARRENPFGRECRATRSNLRAAPHDAIVVVRRTRRTSAGGAAPRLRGSRRSRGRTNPEGAGGRRFDLPFRFPERASDWCGFPALS